MPMATKTPRIYVSFPPETYAAIQAWAKTTGIAGSQLVAMIMTNSVPVVRKMTEAMGVAKTDPQRAMSIMGELVDGASVDVAQMQLDIHGKTKAKKMRRRPRASARA
jgi:hypothetical protein